MAGTTAAGAHLTVLNPADWRAAAARHESTVDLLLAAHLQRRRRGQAHPVEDFLFTYYSHRPAQLRRWHPGVGMLLAGDPPHTGWRGYAALAGGTGVDPALVRRRAVTLGWVRGLLAATTARPAYLGCLGMHEWAMVYRLPPERVRHPALPLRLGRRGTDELVESQRIRCTHFDAFRFFTDAARPRNALQPSRDSQQDLEQPGCLHATMDLYKWAYKLVPFTPSNLVLDAFELARQVRELDMRASPYDLASLGYAPVRVESPEGRGEYAAAQRRFAARGQELRHRLVAVCDAAASYDPPRRQPDRPGEPAPDASGPLPA